MTLPKTLRLWHPSFDVYHCSFRFLRLLIVKSDHALVLEKLYLLDFYVLYPFLLHRASMPNEVRRNFRALHISRPADQFVQLPSEQSLYRELSIFQKAASTNLVAKGLLARDAYLSGIANLIAGTVPPKLLADLEGANLEDHNFMDFLVNQFGALDLIGARGLRALTGLVRRQ
jgi:ABC-3C biological conflict system middle component